MSQYRVLYEDGSFITTAGDHGFVPGSSADDSPQAQAWRAWRRANGLHTSPQSEQEVQHWINVYNQWQAGRSTEQNAARARGTVLSRQRQANVGAVLDRARRRSAPERLPTGTVRAIDNAHGLATVQMDDGGTGYCSIAGAGWLQVGDRVYVQVVKPEGGFVIAKIEGGWLVPPLAPGWTAVVGAQPRYRRDSDGGLEVQGKVAGAPGSAALILNLIAHHLLPLGRTAVFNQWVNLPGPGFAYPVTVTSGGAIAIGDPPAALGGVGITISLHGIAYLTEA